MRVETVSEGFSNQLIYSEFNIHDNNNETNMIVFPLAFLRLGLTYPFSTSATSVLVLMLMPVL